jgi:hypothetical protein
VSGLASLKTCFVIGLLLLALFACGTKVNQSNYEKVQKGMTQAEDENILGPPTEASSVTVLGLSGTSSTWKSKEGTVTVHYLNGKVQIKQFMKP